MQDEQHILIFGNPVDGLTFIGPLPTSDACISYAEVTGEDGGDWWVAPLEQPNPAYNDAVARTEPFVTIFNTEDGTITPWAAFTNAISDLTEGGESDAILGRYTRQDAAILGSLGMYPDLELRDKDQNLIIPVFYMTTEPTEEKLEDLETYSMVFNNLRFFGPSWKEAQHALISEMEDLDFEADDVTYPIKAVELPVPEAAKIVTREDKEGWLIGFAQNGYDHRIDFYSVVVK